MLVYKNDGKLHCISKNALKLAGYGDIAQFLDEHNDYSELFVKKPGYIYNFENFSWISFLRNANPEQKKVLIATRDDATYECDLELEILYPAHIEAGTPEFYFQVEFKNLKLANGTAAEPFVSAPSEMDRQPIEDIYEPPAPTIAQTPEETVVSNAFSPSEENVSKQEAQEIQFGEPTTSSEIAVEEEPSFTFDSEELETEASLETLSDIAETKTAETLESASTPQSSPSKEERLDLVDFSFDEQTTTQELESAEKESEAKRNDALSLDEAFAEALERSQPEAPSQEETSTAETTLSENETIEPTPSLPEASSMEEGSFEMPDTRKISGVLGLPETMVKAFVREFIVTYVRDSHEVDVALQAGHAYVVKKEALKLKGIAANLMMEPLVTILDEILTTTEPAAIKERWTQIDSYIHALAKRHAPDIAATTPTPVEQPTVEKTASDLPNEPSQELAAQTEATLVLEEVDRGETIVFDPAEAANALGLPESLIVEFVNDFVNQARDEKETFEKAFSRGDIKTINEVAHKLKGVAANLRIEDMRALMEETQHATDLEEVRKPLETFYAKLAALHNTMAKEFA